MMKKVLAVIAVLMLSSPAFAKVESKGKLILGANVDYGYTKIGLMSVSGDISADNGVIYGGGIKAGYGVFKSGIVYCGLEFQQKELATKIRDMSGNYKEKFTQKFLDIPLAYRFLVGPMYADLGGFYGVRAGDMKYKDTGASTGSGTIDKKYTNDDYGVLLGIGGLIPVGDNGAIDIGLKAKAGYSYILDTPGNKLGCWSAALSVGYLVMF